MSDLPDDLQLLENQRAYDCANLWTWNQSQAPRKINVNTFAPKILLVILLAVCSQCSENLVLDQLTIPNWYFSLFSSLVYLILYWHRKGKFCLDHSKEKGLCDCRRLRLWKNVTKAHSLFLPVFKRLLQLKLSLSSRPIMNWKQVLLLVAKICYSNVRYHSQNQYRKIHNSQLLFMIEILPKLLELT